MYIDNIATPRTIFSAGLPVIIPSSGNIAANGVVALTTALPVIYSGGCYMYFPESAIVEAIAYDEGPPEVAAVAASPAGFYYVVMSSTTAGVVYNNMLEQGMAPAVPRTLVPFVSANPAAYTQATTIQVMETFRIPGGLLGKNGVLKITTLEMGSGDAYNKTTTIKLGSTAICTSVNTTTGHRKREVELRNRGDEANNLVSLATITPVAGSTITTTAFNTTSDQILTISATVANTASYFVLEAMDVTALYKD